MSGPRGLILSFRGPILRSRGPNLGPKGPLENEVGEKWLVYIFGRWPTRPGGPFVANFTPVTRALAAPLRQSPLLAITVVFILSHIGPGVGVGVEVGVGAGVGVDQEPGVGSGVGVGTAPPRLCTPGRRAAGLTKCEEENALQGPASGSQ